MIDILDKKMLESKFADDFASPYFPILAELYLNDGELSRARKVCEIGLDYDSQNIDGKFVFAKVALEEGRHPEAANAPGTDGKVAFVGFFKLGALFVIHGAVDKLPRLFWRQGILGNGQHLTVHLHAGRHPCCNKQV